jgi:hypothetical protein
MSLLDTGSPIEKFLMGLCEVQNKTLKKGATLSVVQVCILHDLLQAEKLFEQGKSKSREVPLVHIQERYNLERYIVSRNAVSLSNRIIRDRGMRAGKREGKGWVKSAALQDSPDDRLKAIVFTTKGRKIAEMIFSIRR